MGRNWFISGEWNAICDRCGNKYKNTELKIDWQGLMLCLRCWEPRHPQDLIRPVPEQQKLPWTRPESTDQFISVTFSNTSTCSADGLLSQADHGTADCAIVGNINGGLVP